jgi:hypothetical protein
MIILAAVLTVLPFIAVPMVVFLGLIRSCVICGGLLAFYIINPFAYIGALAAWHVDETVISAWQQMMAADIFLPITSIVSVSANWLLAGLCAGYLLRWCWQRLYARRVA